MGFMEPSAEVGRDASAVSQSLANRRSPIARGRFSSGSALPGLAVLGLGSAALLTPVLLRATFDAPTLRAALEMMMTLFAFAAAWLLHADFASSRRLRDLLLLTAILVLGLINLGAAALPAALDLGAGTHFAAARICGVLFVAAMFALAAFTPPKWLVPRCRRSVAITVGLSLAALAAAGLGGLLTWTHGPTPSLAGVVGHPLLVVLVVSATGLLVHAALAFVRLQRSDRVAELVAVATMLMAGAGFSNLLGGSLAPGRIGASEVLRVLAFALILAAAVVAERRVGARLSKATALAERRRVARDLHDGIAQDLAFIAAHGLRFAEELGDEHPIVVAARRALAISRSTISELSDLSGVTAHEALAAVAQELGERFDIAVAVNAQLDRDLETHEREHVTRIAREAIANAARHGRARNVMVSLSQTDTGIALRVIDDGCGIVCAGRAAAPEGFGLRNMRERAAALGGQLSVREARRGGTELEVVLP